MFNHVLSFKRDKAILLPSIKEALAMISEIFTDPKLVDNEALLGLLLCECRMVFMNKNACEFAKNIENFR